MKKLISVFFALVLVFSFPIYASNGDIVGIASNNQDFSILVAALQKANLVDSLKGSGPFTVFAPTDKAFTELLTKLNISASDLLAHPQLSEVLLHHVVSGKVMSKDLKDDMTVKTLHGETLKIDLNNGVMIGHSQVTTADVDASNGVIHIIDKVLIPDSFKPNADYAIPASYKSIKKDGDNLLEVALKQNTFNTLLSALLKSNYDDNLREDGPFTVFAPTDEAFAKLLLQLDVTAEELLNHPKLGDVLLYHVVSNKVMSANLKNDQMVSTLSGKKIKIDLSNGVKINKSNVITADVEANNGVIHVIDSVLIPEGFKLD